MLYDFPLLVTVVWGVGVGMVLNIMFTVLSFFPCLCFGAILEPSFCSNLSGCHRLSCEAFIIIFIVLNYCTDGYDHDHIMIFGGKNHSGQSY